MAEKSLVKLKQEYDKKIKNAVYATDIRATCRFYESEKITEIVNPRVVNVIRKVRFKKDGKIVGYVNKSSSLENKSSYEIVTGAKHYYPKLITAASNIKIANMTLANKINDTIGESLGKTIDVPNENANFVTNVEKESIEKVLSLLDELKTEVLNIDTTKCLKNIKDNIKEPEITITVDEEFIVDSFNKRKDKLQKEAHDVEYSNSIVTYPSLKEFLDCFVKKEPECAVFETFFVNNDLKELLDNSLFEKIDKAKTRVLDDIKKIEGIVKNIKPSYEDLEKKQKKEYENNFVIDENGYIINANDAYVDKLIAKGKTYNKKQMAKLYRKLKKKKSKEDADDIIVKLIRKTGASFYLSDVKSVILKKKKKKNKKDKADTGATIVGTGNNSNNNNGKNKDDDKNKKKKKKQLASAAATAAAKKLKKEKEKTINNIKAGTNNKIEQAKLNLNKKISQIDNDRDAKIANIESKRDNDIANLYDDASNKINNIDATDTDAQQQIDAIKENLENEVNSVNNNANVEIEKIKASAEQQKSQANQNTQNTIEKIQNKSTEEIKNIKENGVSKKTKATKIFESAAKEAHTAENVDTSSLEEANSNKAESAVSLENSKTEYNNSIAEKEQEIVNQTNSVENSNDITESTDVNDLNESTDSIDSNNSTETVATEVENVSNSEQTSVNNQSYNTSDSVERNYSTNSYNSSNSATTSSMNSTNEASNASSTDSIASDVESEVIETPAVPDDSNEVPLIPDNPNNEEIQEIDNSSTSSEILDTPKSESKSSNIAIPIGLGVAATGAAAVAGVRFVKNRKQNEDIDETYDDENNDIDTYESGSDNSEYMKDDYLGPIGSMYTDTDYPEDNELSEIPDDTKYTDAGQLEDDDFSEDEVLNDLG